MKLNLVNWEMVKPGSRMEIVTSNLANMMSSYFVRYDNDLYEIVVYNTYSGELEHYNLSLDKNKIDVDIDSFYINLRNSEYPDPDEPCILTDNGYIFQLKEEPFVVFKESIKYPASLNSKKIFKLIDRFDGTTKTCNIYSVLGKFILHDIHLKDITMIENIFDLDNIMDKYEVDKLKFNTITSEFGIYHLHIKNDKYHKFIIIIVYDTFTRKYGINFISTKGVKESTTLKYTIKNQIEYCFDQIINNKNEDNYFRRRIPYKGEDYLRLKEMDDKDKIVLEENAKFNISRWSCLFDLYFGNIFDKEEYDKNMLFPDYKKKIYKLKSRMKIFNKTNNI